MKKALLFVLVLAVIPVGGGAQSSIADFWRARAEEGDALAQLNLGVMYENGRGVPEDDVEAVRWFRLAAEQGNAFSQSNLGTKYLNGEGVPQDDAEAVRWWRLAAEQRYANAQFMLGVMYRFGTGVPEDNVLAYMWWNLAAAQGNENAQENKDIAEQWMTPEQIAEAQRLSTEWIEAHPFR
ncbi:MAG: tetratricopeptide repeat protein [Gemmatimonadota bacterium]|nr:tetratricopeptide repeat protein [Gemmatimonadota bacterium]